MMMRSVSSAARQVTTVRIYRSSPRRPHHHQHNKTGPLTFTTIVVVVIPVYSPDESFHDPKSQLASLPILP